MTLLLLHSGIVTYRIVECLIIESLISDHGINFPAWLALTLYTFFDTLCNVLWYAGVYVDKMFRELLRVFCLLFFSIIAVAHSQDIVGCGGFIISEVEINFSVIEVCPC